MEEIFLYKFALEGVCDLQTITVSIILIIIYSVHRKNWAPRNLSEIFLFISELIILYWAPCKNSASDFKISKFSFGIQRD